MPVVTYKLGDIVRCKRCKRLYEMNVCGSCSEQHPIAVDMPFHTVVDHVEEFCVECITPEELALIAYHARERVHGAQAN